MYLFVALARALGVPARGVGGFVVDGDAVLKSSNYHNWAEFHADGAWRLADPHRKVFADQRSRYIAMRIIGEQEHGPMGNSHRFLAEDERLEVRMN